MEIAFTMLGIGLTVLGLVLAYIWKSNGELQAKMMINQKSMMTALERITQMLENQTKILEKIEGKL